MSKITTYFLCLNLLTINLAWSSEGTETSTVVSLNDAQFKDFIQTAEKPIIVDFWAPWCQPCLKMKPIFEQLASEYKEQYIFVSVNFDEARQIAKEYGITGIPTFKLIKNNEVLGTFMGYVPKEEFMKEVENSVNKKISQQNFLLAIKTNDKEFVAKCLEDKNIDVNGITSMEAMNQPVPMTPLLIATYQVIYGQSTEIISMLLKAGALIDLEIEFPQFDENYQSLTGTTKETARLVAEHVANIPEEKLNAIEDEAFRTKILESKKNACNLLELFKTFSKK